MVDNHALRHSLLLRLGRVTKAVVSSCTFRGTPGGLNPHH